MKTKMMFCLLLTMTGCTHRGMLPSIPEGTPLKVFAAIDAQQPAQAAATPVGVAADNAYDRSAFVAGDRIRITATRSGATSGVKDYQLTADGVSWERRSGYSGSGDGQHVSSGLSGRIYRYLC